MTAFECRFTAPPGVYDELTVWATVLMPLMLGAASQAGRGAAWRSVPLPTWIPASTMAWRFGGTGGLPVGWPSP